jgi:branched-subunit amino acid ABC-type transport system permease component
MIQQIINGILLGGFFAVVGVGMNMMFGIVKLTNLAHGDFIILAAFLMLDHIDEKARADRIRAALEGTIREGATVTRDLGGSATTAQFTDAIIARLR